MHQGQALSIDVTGGSGTVFACDPRMGSSGDSLCGPPHSDPLQTLRLSVFRALSDQDSVLRSDAD